MNILVVNWSWYPSGGDWTYVENVVKLYEQKGHHVIPFAMKDERNQDTPYSKYFIDNIDYKKVNKYNPVAGIKVIVNSIYSFQAQKNLEKLLDDVAVDVAHINVIHHYITPTILKILKKRNIRIIWTFHEYTPLCPDSIFVSHDKVCEKCYGGAFYNCVINSCKKGSYLASTVAALENYVHKYLNYYQYVDHYVCGSVFQYDKYKQFGFFKEKLVQIHHGFDHTNADDLLEAQIKTEDFIVFVGRLEKIKGAHTLLKAMLSCPGIPLVLIGDGSQYNNLKEFTAQNPSINVTFLGKQTKQETLNIVSKAKFAICPSECYEVLGYTVVEAMSVGKPVIGAAIGGIPEMVIDNFTGLLFPPGDAEQLAMQIKKLYQDDDMIKDLGINAAMHIRQLINNEKHYANLQKLIPGL